MKSIVIFFLLTVCSFAAVENSITIRDGFKIKYTIDGSKISFVLTGTNKDGYVAVGFGGSKMSKVDVAAFKWDGSKVVGEDRSNLDDKGQVKLDTDLGCTNNLTVDSTSTYDSATGAWNIKFSRPLNTNEPTCDQPIIDGQPINFANALFNTFNWGDEHKNKKNWSVTFSSTAADEIILDAYSTLIGFSSLVLTVLMITL